MLLSILQERRVQFDLIDNESVEIRSLIPKQAMVAGRNLERDRTRTLLLLCFRLEVGGGGQ